MQYVAATGYTNCMDVFSVVCTRWMVRGVQALTSKSAIKVSYQLFNWPHLNCHSGCESLS